jgi:hypothetical protein
VPSNGYLRQRLFATATVNSEQCQLRAQSQSRRQMAHRTVNRSCPVHHQTVRWPTCQKLQRSNPNGWVTWLAHRTVRWPTCQKLQRSNPNGWVTWLAHRIVSGGAPDCPVRHTTVAFPTAILVVGAINTPNHHTSMHPSLQPSNLIQELYTSFQDTNKEIKSSPKSGITPNKLVTRVRDLCVLLSSCAWIAFLLPPFLFSRSL